MALSQTERRLDFHNILLELLADVLEKDVSEVHAYFQPPPSVTLSYPCIVYERDAARTNFAMNSPYEVTRKYQVMVIDRTPDSDIPQKVAELPTAVHIRTYSVDNLVHDVYSIYY